MNHIPCDTGNCACTGVTVLLAFQEFLRAQGTLFILRPWKICVHRNQHISCAPRNCACTDTPFLRALLDIVRLQGNSFMLASLEIVRARG
jgi:hypothetical protein